MGVQKSSKDQLIELYKGALPPAYVEPLEIEDDGLGMDLPYAFAAMLELADCASNKGTQALFLREHSEQTDVPAAVLAKASGVLSVARNGAPLGDVHVLAGTRIEAYRTNSFGLEELIGYYVTTEAILLVEGDTTTHDVLVEAEQPGYFGNLKAGDAYFRVAQQGAITVPISVSSTTRIGSYTGAPLHLDRFSESSVGLHGVLEPDEGISFVSVPGTVRYVIDYLFPDSVLVSPEIDASDNGKKGLFRAVQLNDLVSLTQAIDIVGGNGGALGDRGAEMLLPMLENETAAQYSSRLEYCLDVVSPTAIARVVDSILGPLGISWRLLETGDPDSLGGFIWDFHPWDWGSISYQRSDAEVYEVQGAVWLTDSQTKRFFVVAVSNAIDLEPGLAGRLWKRLNQARAKGVSFRLAIDEGL